MDLDIPYLACLLLLELVNFVCLSALTTCIEEGGFIMGGSALEKLRVAVLFVLNWGFIPAQREEALLAMVCGEKSQILGDQWKNIIYEEGGFICVHVPSNKRTNAMLLKDKLAKQKMLASRRGIGMWWILPS